MTNLPPDENMNTFSDTDIEDLLLNSTSAQYGVYNHLQWSIATGIDATDDISRTISIHEFMHNDLNNITVYGMLLQGLAYLAKENFSDNLLYKEKLQQLVKKSRTAHEVYATYLGIILFARINDDEYANRILQANPLYTNYYNIALKLVQDINSLYLKQQVLVTIIRICFQSKYIAKKALEDLSNLDINSIPSEDFPDNRLEYFSNHLPQGFILNCVKEFLEQYDDIDGKQLLSQAINGQENLPQLFAAENNRYTVDITTYLYIQLDGFLQQNNTTSCAPDIHLEYMEELLPKLDCIFAFHEAKNPLVINQTPFDYDKNILLSFENETWLFSNRPLHCRILFAEEAHSTFPFHGVGSPPHLFITARDSRLIHQQYEFITPEYKKRFENINGPFTALRYAVNDNDKREIVYVIFDNPESLKDFLCNKTEDTVLIGCISAYLAHTNEAWWDKWIDTFIEQCHTACILLDVSPLHYIENIFTSFDSIYYQKAIIKTTEKTQTAIIFDAVNNNTTQAILLAPCSDMYCQSMHYYINLKFKEQYTEGLTIPEHNLKMLPIILTHIFREEQLFYFHSATALQ